VVAWGIALIYSRKASQDFDLLAAQIAADFASGSAAASEAAASDDASVAAKSKKDLAALDKAVAKANADIANWGDAQTSFMGLEQPLIELGNPPGSSPYRWASWRC
jgi:hypothetical protein